MRDYGTSASVAPAYGFDHSDAHFAEEDRRTMERLDKLIREQSCEICKKMLTDSQRPSRRCFKHRKKP